MTEGVTCDFTARITGPSRRRRNLLRAVPERPASMVPAVAGADKGLAQDNHPRREVSMSIRTLKVSALTAVVAATVLFPGLGAAQIRGKSAPPPSPAIALENQARPMMDQPKKWAEMADLFLQAAQIRTADDPRGVDDLILAAGGYRWSGKRSPARAAYVAAGERALALGDVVRAADAFLTAALIANEQKDLAAAWQLKGHAERLAQSPLLTDGQRRLILGQFGATLQVAEHH